MTLGTYHFHTEPFHVDFTGSIALSVISNHLLNVAGKNANENGFGIDYLNEHNYTWVLSRLVMEFDELPRQYESFSIDTWVESVMSLFSGRNFIIRNASGAPLGYARSMWAMIDLNTRQPANLLTLRDGVMTHYINTDAECPIDGPSRIKLAPADPVRSIEVRYSDIDINIHHNAVRYIEHILDLFPLDTYRTHRIRRFEIAYVSESLFGDVLDLYHQQESDGTTSLVEIRKQATNEVVCRAKIGFAPAQ